MTTEIEATADEERSTARSRRALLGLGAVAVGTAALAAGSKEAKADLQFHDIVGGVTQGINNTISAPIKSINSILGTAFHGGVGISMPTTLQEVIACILGPFGLNFNFNGCQALLSFIGGQFSLLQTGRISGNMERIWKKPPPGAPEERDDAELEAFDAIYEQVTASQATTATLAEAQGPLEIEDRVTRDALLAAAEEGHLIAEVALLGQLQYSQNQRLGMIIQALNAQQGTLSYMAMDEPNRRRLSIEARREEREPTMYPVGGAAHTVSGGRAAWNSTPSWPRSATTSLVRSRVGSARRKASRCRFSTRASHLWWRSVPSWRWRGRPSRSARWCRRS